MADLASPDRHITAKDMECLKEAFALFDRDRDGEINTEELGKVYYHLEFILTKSEGICNKINQNPVFFSSNYHEKTLNAATCVKGILNQSDETLYFVGDGSLMLDW